MEYLTDLVTTVPDGTSQTRVDELRGAEAARAAELAKAGHLIRLWRPPLNPGEWRSIGLFRAADEAELLFGRNCSEANAPSRSCEPTSVS